ncbi:hypothetical protein FHG87_006994 [Trinorchestia longiramus]|nr:hypothetical protein FHG87_006994 [Trinorchestia longiramus]
MTCHGPLRDSFTAKASITHICSGSTFCSREWSENSQRVTTSVRSSYSRGSEVSCNGEDAGVQLSTHSRSFLQDRSKVSGFGDVMGRMAATNSGEGGEVSSDDQARSLLNRFLGAQVLLTGVESMMATSGGAGPAKVSESSTTTSSETKRTSKTISSNLPQRRALLQLWPCRASYGCGPRSQKVKAALGGCRVLLRRLQCERCCCWWRLLGPAVPDTFNASL